MKRPTQWCDSCESTVYADSVHSCYDAKAVREQQERESALTTAERERDEARRERDDARKRTLTTEETT
jgi:hypothetical protein